MQRTCLWSTLGRVVTPCWLAVENVLNLEAALAPTGSSAAVDWREILTVQRQVR
jgi:hypothetical protein